jgi:hypothetical protein
MKMSQLKKPEPKHLNLEEKKLNVANLYLKKIVQN